MPVSDPFDAFVHDLAAALQRPLPGPAAQAVLAPRPRREWPQGFNPARIRLAAGLLLLFPRQAHPHVVLTVRSDRVRHSGQVSLPGGVVEPGESFADAALREAREEVGLDTTNVRVLGHLTPLDIPVSGFRLHPIVAATAIAPRLAPSDEEVARILEVPMAELIDPARFKTSDRERDGRWLSIPAFHVAGQEIWGATAMVLAEFLALTGWSGPTGDAAEART